MLGATLWGMVMLVRMLLWSKKKYLNKYWICFHQEFFIHGPPRLNLATSSLLLSCHHEVHVSGFEWNVSTVGYKLALSLCLYELCVSLLTLAPLHRVSTTAVLLVSFMVGLGRCKNFQTSLILSHRPDLCTDLYHKVFLKTQPLQSGTSRQPIITFCLKLIFSQRANFLRIGVAQLF